MIKSIYSWEKTKATSNRLENRSSKTAKRYPAESLSSQLENCHQNCERMLSVRTLLRTRSLSRFWILPFLRPGSSDFSSFPFFLSKLFRGYFCCLHIKILNYIKCFISIFKNNKQNQNTQEGQWWTWWQVLKSHLPSPLLSTADFYEF